MNIPEEIAVELEAVFDSQRTDLKSVIDQLLSDLEALILAQAGDLEFGRTTLKKIAQKQLRADKRALVEMTDLLTASVASQMAEQSILNYHVVDSAGIDFLNAPPPTTEPAPVSVGMQPAPAVLTDSEPEPDCPDEPLILPPPVVIPPVIVPPVEPPVIPPTDLDTLVIAIKDLTRCVCAGVITNAGKGTITVTDDGGIDTLFPPDPKDDVDLTEEEWHPWLANRAKPRPDKPKYALTPNDGLEPLLDGAEHFPWDKWLSPPS